MGPLAIDELQDRVRGTVVDIDHDDYDQARRVHNAMHDRRPAAIVRAHDEADVLAAVRHARDHDLELAVRGGGHGVAGHGTADGALVIDLGGLRWVRVDPEEGTARVGAGAVLGDLDHATHVHGLATPTGFNSTTGIAGLSLGGGIGAYLSRRYGLTCDNLTSADVVTANGLRVTTNGEQNPDLFWALRGGGGNFGIVTSFKFRLHPLRGFAGGPIFFELDDAPEVMRTFRDHTAEAPRELGGFFGFHLAPPLPFIPEDRHGEPMCVVVTSWCGDETEADEMFAPLRQSGTVVAEHVETMPYPALQSAFDPLLPPGLHHYWKSDFVADLTEEAIDQHMKHGPRVPTVNSAVHLYLLDGAVHDPAPDETAFPVRDARFSLNIAGIWDDPASTDEQIAWVRDYHMAVHPHSGYEGAYTNFLADDEADRVAPAFGANLDRLRRVKAHWDPDNVFHLNHNITPATTE